MSGRAVFYYDFNSPYAWLAAERIESLLPEPPVWAPISYGRSRAAVSLDPAPEAASRPVGGA